MKRKPETAPDARVIIETWVEGRYVATPVTVVAPDLTAEQRNAILALSTPGETVYADAMEDAHGPNPRPDTLMETTRGGK